VGWPWLPGAEELTMRYDVTDECGLLHGTDLTMEEADILADVLEQCGHAPNIIEVKADGSCAVPLSRAA
jgi:hypothetical protein